ncbi:hypothetical protein [uncultured Nostoc sp.]
MAQGSRFSDGYANVCDERPTQYHPESRTHNPNFGVERVFTPN